MNKYQSALDLLYDPDKWLLDNKVDFGVISKSYAEECKNDLQKLVDRATPMKAKHYEKDGRWVNMKCPKCGRSINATPYCPECGQTLDWSDSK